MSDTRSHTTLKHIIGENRIYLILGFVFAVMAWLAPRFLTTFNISTITTVRLS